MAPFLILALLAGASSREQHLEGAFRRADDLCWKAAERLYGRRPIRRDAKRVPPRQLLHVAPQFPEGDRPRIGSGMWRGEALLGTDGEVKGVWIVTRPQFQPPWPEWSAAIPAAVKKWRYGETLVGGEPVPVCMSIVVNINWK